MIIGIIGGIGSGKSTVSDYMSSKYGFLVLKSDNIAKDIMNSDPEVIEELKGAFGDDIYGNDGFIDKKKYADIIYGSEKCRKLSNSIIHPVCWKKIRSIISDRIMDEGGKECDIIIETALPSDVLSSVCDEIWLIYADPEERINRLIENRGYSREYAEGIINKQLSYNSFMEFADRMINNGGSKSQTVSVIDKILSEKGDGNVFCKSSEQFVR